MNLLPRALFAIALTLTGAGCATTVPATGDADDEDDRDPGPRDTSIPGVDIGGGADGDGDEPDVREDIDTPNPDGGDPDVVGTPDGVSPDGGTPDTGTPDGGPTDTGTPDGGALCGNGRVDPGEPLCDDGIGNSDSVRDSCRTNCTRFRCGDGVVDTGERCDDGDAIDNNACANTCVPVSTILCAPCTADTECGRSVDRCVTLPGGRYCGTACSTDADCSAAYRCASVASAAERQCIPRTGVCAPCYDPDGDGYGTGDECAGNDCNETSTAAYAGAPEICDDLDNDCDGTADEGLTKSTWYPDTDGDGFGAATGSREACVAPAGFVSNDDDCDDSRATVSPGDAEICDGLDNDCDGSRDEGFPTAIYTIDADRDGYGAVGGATRIYCGPLDGYATATGDCNDAAATAYPGAPEICDTIDNDCDGAVNEDVSTPLYPDGDRDGFGAAGSTATPGCPSAGLVANNTDCDDANAAVRPGGTETCDGRDNNCDGTVDNGATCTGCTQRNNGARSYLFCIEPVGWPAANTACNAFGNYRLVTIDDATENTFVRSTAITGLCTNTCRYPNDFDCDDGGPGFDFDYCDFGTDCGDCGSRGLTGSVWIGFNDRTTEGTFVWAGAPSTFTSWNSGEPNNSSNEDCTELNRSSGNWNDLNCGDARSYVCESQ